MAFQKHKLRCARAKTVFEQLLYKELMFSAAHGVKSLKTPIVIKLLLNYTSKSQKCQYAELQDIPQISLPRQRNHFS
jgi:hypothetical protein